MRGSGRTVAPDELSRLEHQLAYSTGNKSFPSSENRVEESCVGSVFGRNISVIFAGLNRDGNNPVAAQISRFTSPSLGRGDRVIVPQQFVHNSRPQRRGALHSKRVTHRAAIGISNPHGDGVLFVEADGPGISEAAARTGLRSDPFVEGQGRIETQSSFSRASLSHKISVIISVAAVEATAGHGEKFGGQQFWSGRQSAAGQTGVGCGEVGQSNFGVAKDESGTVVIDAAGKIESPTSAIRRRLNAPQLG